MLLSIFKVVVLTIAIFRDKLGSTDAAEVLGHKNSLVEMAKIPTGTFATTNYSLESTDRYNELILAGTDDEFEAFITIPSELGLTLKSISLLFIRFEVDTFLKSLEGCINLEILNLTNVEYDGYFLKKIHLPKLKTFIFTTYDRYKFRSSEISSYIFFYKNFVDWEQDTQLWREVDIVLQKSRNSDPSLLIEKDKLEIRDLDDFASNFLTTLLTVRSEIKTLTLHKITLYASQVKYFQTIKTLELVDITMSETSVSEILSNCYEAEHVSIDARIEPESVDIAIIEVMGYLRSIQLGGVSLRWSSESRVFHFNQIEIFYLGWCDFVPSLVSFSSSLKILGLTEVNILRGSINDLFKFNMLPPLDKLLLDRIKGEDAVVDVSLIPFVDDLILQECEISYSLAQATNISSVQMLFVKISDSLTHNFSVIFKNTKTFKFLDEVSSLLLNEVLKTEVRSFEFYFDWDDNAKDSVSYETAINFLKGLGIPKGSTNLIELRLNGTKLECIDDFDGWYNSRLKIDILTVYQIIVFTVCSLGLIGNTISALVLCRKEMLKFSSSYILLGLAFWDSLFLITSLTQIIWMSVQFNHRHFNESAARVMQILLYPLNKLAYTGSVYLTVLITIDRVIAVSMPLRAKTLLTSKRTLKNILFVSLFSVFLNFTRWIESISWGYPLDGKYWNSFHPPSLIMFNEYRKFYLLYGWSFFMYVIPFVLMMVLNVKIWFEVRRANRARRGLAGRTNNTETSVTRMLMSVVILFLICNSINALIVWYFIYEDSHRDYGISATNKFGLVIIELYAFQPLLINSSSNFIIYCTMGTKFRSECKKLFCSIFKICDGTPFLIRPRTATDVHASAMQTETQNVAISHIVENTRL